MENNSKIILAAIAGAAVGAGLALLFAPQSGKETRQKIADKFNNLKDNAKELGEKTKAAANAAKDAAKEEFNNA